MHHKFIHTPIHFVFVGWWRQKRQKRDTLVNVASSRIVESLQKLIYQKDTWMLGLYKEKAILSLVDKWIVKLPVRTPPIPLRQFFFPSFPCARPASYYSVPCNLGTTIMLLAWYTNSFGIFGQFIPVLFLNHFLHMCSMLESIQLLAVLTRFIPEFCKMHTFFSEVFHILISCSITH